VLNILVPPTGSYLSERDSHLKDLPNFTPTFTSKMTVETTINTLYLTTSGLNSMKTLLWVLNYKFININYSPFIVPFCSLLLIYQSESRSFEVLDFLITTSCEKRELLEKFFTTEAEQFKVLVGLIVSTIFQEIEGLRSLVHARRIDFPKAISELLKSFFIGYFKLTFLQRFLSLFLAEGLTALVKISVGIFKVAADSLSEFRKDFNFELKQFLYSQDDDDPIFTAALKVKITKNALKDLEVPDLTGLTVFKYFRPRLEFQSSIASVCELELIWTYLPDFLRHSKAVKSFSTADNGYSLKNLIRTCSVVKGQKGTILLIKTKSKDIVGGFFEAPVKICSSYVGSFSSFVFTLKPIPKFYSSSGVNDFHAFFSENVVLFGGGKNGIALSVDQELLHASSSECETYANPVLVDSFFEILDLEVLSIVTD
jgi:hypothetical protein